MVKDGKKNINLRSITQLASYARQRLKRTGKNGKTTIITPLDNFFKTIRRGMGVVSRHLEHTAIQTITEHSYRKTEKIIDSSFSKETIRQQVLQKGEQARNLAQTCKEEKLISERQLKDVQDKHATYKQTKGNSLRKKLAKVFKSEVIYIMVDGLQVFQNTGKADSRESKVGIILRQYQGKIFELATWCTWGRVKAFRLIVSTVIASLSSTILDIPIIMVSDGAKWIRNLRKYIPGLKKAIWILDWFHLKGKLLKVLNVFEIDEESTTAQELIGLLWQGQSVAAKLKINQLPQSKDKQKQEKEQEAVQKFCTYLDNQQEGIINYQAYKQQGYIVGSGYVEKMNDMLVKRRMVNQKRMRWSRQGGEAMMALLTAQHNGRLAELFV